MHFATRATARRPWAGMAAGVSAPQLRPRKRRQQQQGPGRARTVSDRAGTRAMGRPAWPPRCVCMLLQLPARNQATLPVGGCALHIRGLASSAAGAWGSPSACSAAGLGRAHPGAVCRERLHCAPSFRFASRRGPIWGRETAVVQVRWRNGAAAAGARSSLRGHTKGAMWWVGPEVAAHARGSLCSIEGSGSEGACPCERRTPRRFARRDACKRVFVQVCPRAVQKQAVQP